MKPYFLGKSIPREKVVKGKITRYRAPGGGVTALSVPTFAGLVQYIHENRIRLKFTEAEYRKLSAEDRKSAKAVDYLTPAAFREEISKRDDDHASQCYLLFTDLDNSVAAQRLLESDWSVLKPWPHLVWHSANSTKLAPRLRIMLAADAIPLSEYKASVKSLADRLGILSDLKSENFKPSQPMYLPVWFTGQNGNGPFIRESLSGVPYPSVVQDLIGPAPGQPEKGPLIVPLENLGAKFENLTLEDAAAELKFLDPNCSREDWINVGNALKYQFGEAGFALWVEWSRGSVEKFPDEAEMQVQWKAMNSDPKCRPVTYASIRAKSKAKGFHPPLPATPKDALVLPSNCGLSFTESAKMIFSAIAPTHQMFTRNGVVHEVRKEGHRLEPLKGQTFRSRLEHYGRLTVHRLGKKGKTGVFSTVCPKETADALLVTREIELLPPISLIVDHPILILNGGRTELVTLKIGWNEGGIYVTDGWVPPVVAFNPATVALLGLTTDFLFPSPGDKSRFFASLITPALKLSGLLDVPTPIEVYEADQSQAGKGYLAKVRAAIHGKPTFITPRVGGVGSFDESISEALIDGNPFVQFDNFRGHTISAHLEGVITAEGLLMCRAPSRGSVRVDTRPFSFLLTSNGFSTTIDLANRISVTRILKQPSGYSFKGYPEGELLTHVAANRGYYLGCIHSVIREYHSHGCPKTNEMRHDFRGWARTLDWIVQHLLGLTPLLDGHDEAKGRLSDPGRSWLRCVAHALAAKNQLNLELTAHELAEFSTDNGILVDANRSISDSRAVGVIMKMIFREGETVNIEGFTVIRRSRATADWKEGWCYLFTRGPSDLI